MDNKWRATYESAKQELIRRNLSWAEYELELKKLCKKYRL